METKEISQKKIDKQNAWIEKHNHIRKADFVLSTNNEKIKEHDYYKYLNENKQLI